MGRIFLYYLYDDSCWRKKMKFQPDWPSHVTSRTYTHTPHQVFQLNWLGIVQISFVIRIENAGIEKKNFHSPRQWPFKASASMISKQFPIQFDTRSVVDKTKQVNVQRLCTDRSCFQALQVIEFGLVQLNSTQFSSVQFSWIQFGAVDMRSCQWIISSAHFTSSFGTISFCSVAHSEIHKS